MKTLIAVVSLLVSSQLLADTRVIPVVTEGVQGANGSEWRTEVRFYNSGARSETIRFTRAYPLGDTECTLPGPIDLGPGAQTQVRSIGCSGAAALEIDAPSSVEIQAILTNVGPFQQEACCFVGFSETIPVVPLERAFSHSQTIANLLVVRKESSAGHYGRHNLGVVNPNPFPVRVELVYFDRTGERVAPNAFPYDSFVVSAQSLLQINNLFPFVIPDIPAPYLRDWRVQATADAPILLYDAYVDNATNDATITLGK